MFKKKLIISSTYKLCTGEQSKEIKSQFETVDNRKKNKDKSLPKYIEPKINSEKKIKRNKSGVGNLFKSGGANSTHDLTGSCLRVKTDIGELYTPGKKLSLIWQPKLKSNKKKERR